MPSTSINRTNSSASGTTWTVSCWVKQCQNTGDGGIFQFYQNNSNVISLYSNPIVKFRAFISDGYSAGDMTLNVLKRDPNAWSHYVAVCDTTNSTAADRWRLYINGDRVDDDSNLVSSKTNPSSSYSFSPVVGGDFNLGAYFSNFSNHNYAHVHYCDGYAYTASNFGSTDATTGEWKPNTAPSVTYGTNGFFLKFEDRASLLTDSSGNNQTMSLSGSGNVTQTIDNPSNVFATLNPVAQYGSNQGTLSNGNTTWVWSNYQVNARSTLGMPKGKFYWEIKCNGDEGSNRIGMCTSGFTNFIDTDSTSAHYNSTGNGGVYLFNTAAGTSWTRINNDTSKNSDTYTNAIGLTTGNIIMNAVDVDAGKYWVGINGTWFYSGNPATGANPQITFTNSGGDDLQVFLNSGTNNSRNLSVNFGNGYFGTTAVSSAGSNASGIGIFEYDVPAGYTALSTKGLNL